MARPWAYTTLEDRFWAKVVKGGDSECWRWRGNLNGDGYGVIRRPGPRSLHFVWLAHRLSWEWHRGPIPSDLCVCHTCDCRVCVNPGHLFLGTRADNNHDKVRKGRQPHNRGESNPNAKIEDEDAVTITRLAAEGMKQTDIACLFGITQPQVSRIVRRESWALRS